MGKPKAIDLFCGAGGLSQGLVQAGFRVVGAIECENVFAESYLLNHPHTKMIQEDVAKTNLASASQLWKVKPDELDLLAGCPPCQGFSTIGTRNRAASNNDPRNDLVFQMVRFAKFFRPKIIMIENVPALAKDERMSAVRDELRELGYQSDVKILNTSNYSVPQKRRRMIFLASRIGAISVPEVKSGMFAPRTVRDAFSALSTAPKENDPLQNYSEHRRRETRRRISLIPKNGGSRKDLPPEYELGCHRRSDGFKDVYGRMAWDLPSPTITGGCINPSKGRFLHPEEDRAINLREAALLQTFPLSYQFSFKSGRQGVATMIGNALPPAFIEFHARYVKALINKHYRAMNGIEK